MKVAEVEYTGRVRQQRHVGASGTTYRFRGDRVAEVEDLADARQFERKPNFAVNWTGLGRLAAVVSAEAEEIGEALESIDYQVKRKLASELDINANQKEKELNEALEDQAERLQQQMEHQF